MSHNNLEELECRLFSIEPNHCTGILVPILLLKCLTKLLPDSDNNPTILKCYRYVLTAVDAIFTSPSRGAMLTALSMVSYEGGSGVETSLQDMMVYLGGSQGGSHEEMRQAGKLRQVVSAHVLNLLVNTVSLSQYFPVSIQTSTDAFYHNCISLLASESHSQLKE